MFKAGAIKLLIGLTQDAAGGPWVNVWNGFGGFFTFGGFLTFTEFAWCFTDVVWGPLAKSLLWSRWEPIIAPMP